jgi:hypothetical protein
MDNPINAMRSFFAHKSREVTLQEFTAFWKVLSNEDKNTFREAIQAWDGQSEFITAVQPLALPPSSVVVAAA